MEQRTRHLEVNDLNWIVTENLERAQYKIIGVLETYYGSDGRVRSALVNAEVGKLKKPIVKMAPLLYESVFMLSPLHCSHLYCWHR